ncbi:MAG: GIY-YIG nuclease family protein [Gammaproteobacteria bacterium]|nr:GIY-YIG nuclease family protein [Gammaproteobacteria bacterium]MDH5777428.1 GIY-YIG nuclease family protein [Gammaproteobacteria bacterium]
MWYVYILRCADNSLYAGVTTEPQRRLQEHNVDNKLGARYTRARRPVEMVYQEECGSRSEACQRESEIKKMTRTAKEQLVSSFVAVA